MPFIIASKRKDNEELTTILTGNHKQCHPENYKIFLK